MRSALRGLAFAASICALATLAQAADLRVEVVRGESAINSAKLSGVSPEVRVTDSAGKPVSQAMVVFTAPSTGPSVDFGGAGPVAQAETDSTGSVIAPPFRPVTGDGPLDIEVLASVHGDTGNAVIHQMNMGFTVPEAAGGYDILIQPVTSNDKVGDFWPMRVKVVDRTGHGVAGVPIDFILRAVKPQGKFEVLAQQTVNSGPEGAAQYLPRVKTKGIAAQYLVRVTANGVKSTRVFPAP